MNAEGRPVHPAPAGGAEAGLGEISQARILFAGLFASFVALPFTVAGAQDLTFVIVFCALIAFPVLPSEWRVQRLPWAALACALFILWATISVLWREDDQTRMQALRFVAGVPLYALFALQLGRLKAGAQARVEAMLIFLAISLGLALSAESLTGAAFTGSFKIAVEGYDPASGEFARDTMKRLGHGALVYLMIAGPAAAIAWREGGTVIAGVILALAAFVAFSFSIEINILALFGAAVAAGIAWRAPRPTLSILFGEAAAGFVVLPLLLPSMAASISPGVREALPDSWQWRLDIWVFAGEQIEQKLWLGHGMDAGRAIEGVGDLNGAPIDLMPIHPHSAPLQVWMETGIVGALLAGVALIMLGGRIAGAARLSRLQAAAAAWVITAYAMAIFFSYGAWQEWHQAALALAAGYCFFLGAPEVSARRSERGEE